MTLNTHIKIVTSASPQEVFSLVLDAVLAAGYSDADREKIKLEEHWRGEIPSWLKPGLTPEQEEEWRVTENSIETVPGQGLPAWTLVGYDPDQEPDAEGRMQYRAFWDTSYGYSYRGMGVADLHSKALMILSGMLPEGSEISWQDEFTMEWHDGVTPENLRELVQGGLNASEWFNGVVKPAIISEFGRENVEF